MFRALEKADYRNLLRSTSRIKTHFFTCNFLNQPLEDQNTPRAGWLLPKKLVPLAVRRNLIKRIIRNQLSLRADKLDHLILLFRPTGAVKMASTEAVKASLNEIFTQLEISTIS